ncbi:minor capsid protein [Streptomyces sp. MSC1_001]|uniref:minor capsid protein n=1 Tax=Streptomyces sp. MSC1_001 TaxID=2909263 RepID=UPI0020305C8B|nr:minor capsid protein [Streptomyces sp. MSC1_001]
MGYTRDLLEGGAALLAAAGLGEYRPGGIYGPDEDITAIGYGTRPEAPHRILWLNPYPVEDTNLTDALTGLQVWIRSGPDPLEASDMADGVFAALHNRQGLVLGDTRVALIWRQSQALLGQDPHGRQEMTANYYVRATRPAPHLID